MNNHTKYRPRLGELVTLHPDADSHALRIELAFIKQYGDHYIEAHVEVEGVPNWYNLRHYGGIVVNGHTISRGGPDVMNRSFYILQKHGWEPITDPAQFAA
jgi:hypothetical protein